MGAGAIGCYLGGRLAAHGVDVVLVGRRSLADEVAEHGLRLSDYRGWERTADVSIATEPAALSGCDVVLVTVKGGDTEAAGAALARVLDRRAVVVSFQNGVDNPERLRAALEGQTVLAGMVPFNVLRSEGARFHQGTSGKLAIEPGADDLVRALVRVGLPTRVRADMRGVLWGKLLVNLANSVNALSGVPIQTMLRQRGYRLVMAACFREGLAAVRAAGIRPVLDVPLPPALAPLLLSLPDGPFRIAARSMLHVDPEARSSMWDDLSRGRKTEIGALNGAIVALADRVGTPAPVNARLVALIQRAEVEGSPNLSAADLRHVTEV